MPELKIDVALELTDEDAAVIADTLGCEIDDLEAVLVDYAPAAMREYIEMFAGQAMSTVKELRERRLMAILLEIGPKAFPSDEAIARMFNLTSTAARSLLRSTGSRHRARLKPVIAAAANRFVSGCKQSQAGSDWEGRCASAFIIDTLNNQLANSEQPRSPIRRKQRTFDTYVVSNGAKNELARLYHA